MTEKILNNTLIDTYRKHLIREEKSTATVEKYLRDVRAFYEYVGEKSITKELVMAYKKLLVEKRSSPSTPCWSVSTVCFPLWAGRIAK